MPIRSSVSTAGIGFTDEKGDELSLVEVLEPGFSLFDEISEAVSSAFNLSSQSDLIISGEVAG